ncbi:MAG: hypothetical protein HQ567_00665 [Candidatus Nealsonbacteria bacterium]|nr:hypothetical protein [Candidatus Nealsonbacteria bacterium]
MDKLKSSLTEPHRRLVELMQQVNFGRIENLAVRSGRPVLDPPPRIVREVKFGGQNGARPEASSGNFALKAQVVELLQYIDAMRNGLIEVLEIKHGLPFRIIVEGAA